MSNYVYKTVQDMYNDSYERGYNGSFYIDKIDDFQYLVTNAETNKSYTVDVLEGVPMSCDCPHFRYRCENNHIPCKHMISVTIFINNN